MLNDGSGDDDNFEGPHEPRRNRFDAQLMSPVAMIRTINRPVMEDRAYQYKYKRLIPLRNRRVLEWLAALEATHKEHPTAGTLIDLVASSNDSSEPTARSETTWALDRKLISREKDGTRVYYYFDREQAAIFRSVLELRKIIDKVIDLQEADPTNPTAGSELLPPEVYYNIIARTRKD